MASGSHCPIGLHLVNGRRDGAAAPVGADVLWYHTGQLWVSDLRSPISDLRFPVPPLEPSRPLRWLSRPLRLLSRNVDRRSETHNCPVWYHRTSAPTGAAAQKEDEMEDEKKKKKQSLKRYMASGSHCPIGSHKLLVVVMGQRPR